MLRQLRNVLYGLTPFCRIHHILHSYGWAILLPFTGWAIGLFGPRYMTRFGVLGPNAEWLKTKIEGRRIRLIRRSNYHNCTRTGIY